MKQLIFVFTFLAVVTSNASVLFLNDSGLTRIAISDQDLALPMYQELRLPVLLSNGGFREKRPYKNLSLDSGLWIRCGEEGDNFKICVIQLTSATLGDKYVETETSATATFSGTDAEALSAALPENQSWSRPGIFEVQCRESVCTVTLFKQ